MNDTTRLADPAAISRVFSAQLAFLSSNPPQTSALIYLLPPCLVLIAIDVATRLAPRPAPKPTAAEVAPKMYDAEVRHVITRVHEVLIKFQSLERKFSTEQARSQHLARMLQKQTNFALHRQRLVAHNAEAQHESHEAGPEVRAPNNDNASPKNPFEAFCQRLLLQNKIWAQQREIRALQKNLDSMKKQTSSNAFQVFCDRLLLSNNIWKQQKEIDRLMGEAEKLKRSRVAAVTRAAKQMVLDVRKERLTEEFVKDLIAEVEECKQAVVTLRSEHEREIQELAEDWRQQCRKLSKEVEQLKLARDAHLVAQDLSNDQESRLIERLALTEHTLATALDERLDELTEPEDSIEGENDDTMSSFDSLEHMSNTSTSTCVGSGTDHSPNAKTSFDDSPVQKRPANERRATLPALRTPARRQSLTYISLSPTSSKPSKRKMDPGPYVGFSFNPLFFGTGNCNQNEDETETESSIKRVRAISLKSTHSLESRKSGRGSSLSMRSTMSTTSEIQPPKRAQWRL